MSCNIGHGMKTGGQCGPRMNCGCGCGNRHFLSRKEQIEKLDRYREQLKMEIRGVEQHLEKMKQE